MIVKCCNGKLFWDEFSPFNDIASRYKFLFYYLNFTTDINVLNKPFDKKSEVNKNNIFCYLWILLGLLKLSFSLECLNISIDCISLNRNGSNLPQIQSLYKYKDESRKSFLSLGCLSLKIVLDIFGKGYKLKVIWLSFIIITYIVMQL